MSGSVHLRGIMIAGALAALALALGFVTLTMNQSASPAAVHTVLPLKQRHLASASATTGAKAHPVAKPRVVRKPDANLVAALQAGLPRSVARALAAHKAVVVQLTSAGDSIAKLANGEARAGAALAGASFVPVDVDKDGGDVETMTRLLGKLPMAPATLVYTRPATLYVTLDGFNDRTTIEQAAANAAAPGAATTAQPAATTSAATTAAAPAATTTTSAATPTGAG